MNYLTVNLKMHSILIYDFPPSAPCRAVIMTANMLNLDIKTKNVNLLKKEQLSQEFLKVTL